MTRADLESLAAELARLGMGNARVNVACDPLVVHALVGVGAEPKRTVYERHLTLPDTGPFAIVSVEIEIGGVRFAAQYDEPATEADKAALEARGEDPSFASSRRCEVES